MCLYVTTYRNTKVHAAVAISLPAVLGGTGGGLDCGTGDGPGSGGDPVPAVPGNEAREYRG